MRAIVIATVFLGLVVVGDAQTGPVSIQRMGAGGGHAVMKANSMAYAGGVNHLKGDVEITFGNGRITADEADFYVNSNRVDLRGNVSVSLPTDR